MNNLISFAGSAVQGLLGFEAGKAAGYIGNITGLSLGIGVTWVTRLPQKEAMLGGALLGAASLLKGVDYFFPASSVFSTAFKAAVVQISALTAASIGDSRPEREDAIEQPPTWQEVILDSVVTTATVISISNPVVGFWAGVLAANAIGSGLKNS